MIGARTRHGIGAGWWPREHAGFGLPFPPGRDRLDELKSAIETLRALWQPGTRPYRSERVWLPETTCYPRPVSLPHLADPEDIGCLAPVAAAFA